MRLGGHGGLLSGGEIKGRECGQKRSVFFRLTASFCFPAASCVVVVPPPPEELYGAFFFLRAYLPTLLYPLPSSPIAPYTQSFSSIGTAWSPPLSLFFPSVPVFCLLPFPFLASSFLPCCLLQLPLPSTQPSFPPLCLSSSLYTSVLPPSISSVARLPTLFSLLLHCPLPSTQASFL